MLYRIDAEIFFQGELDVVCVSPEKQAMNPESSVYRVHPTGIEQMALFRAACEHPLAECVRC